VRNVARRLRYAQPPKTRITVRRQHCGRVSIASPLESQPAESAGKPPQVFSTGRNKIRQSFSRISAESADEPPRVWMPLWKRVLAVSECGQTVLEAEDFPRFGTGFNLFDRWTPYQAEQLCISGFRESPRSATRCIFASSSRNREILTDR
jgi:hypothetical protein